MKWSFSLALESWRDQKTEEELIYTFGRNHSFCHEKNKNINLYENWLNVDADALLLFKSIKWYDVI